MSHSAGTKSLGKGAERPNAWFVGMVPRRNPDIVVVVLAEHGGWGAGSAPVAAQIIEAFVDKQRRLDNNLQEAKVAGEGGNGRGMVEQPESGAGHREACHCGRQGCAMSGREDPKDTPGAADLPGFGRSGCHGLSLEFSSTDGT